MAESLSNYDDLKSASNNLEIISNELKAINYHLNKINENIKLSLRGNTGAYLTNTIIPCGINKSLDLSEKSAILAKEINLLAQNIDSEDTNVEDTDLDFL